MRKKIEKKFWDMEIIGNRRKILLLNNPRNGRKTTLLGTLKINSTNLCIKIYESITDEGMFSTSKQTNLSNLP